MKKTEYNKLKKEILQKNNIKPSQVGKRENFPGAKDASIEIMLLSGMNKRLSLAAVYGVQDTPKCNISAYLGDVWNFCSMYDGCCLEYCIELADKYFDGITECEVGLKYPEFNKQVLISRYELKSMGEFEPLWSKERYEERKAVEPDMERTFYEVWENEDKTVTFSFERGRMGIGGYAGATFDNLERAVCFVEWFFQNPANYVKDVDLFLNRLGGFGLKQIAEIRATQLQPA